MIYPVSYLIRQEVLANGGEYIFTVEDQLSVRFVADAYLTFHNPNSANAEFKITYTVAKSAIFSDSFSIVDEIVPANNIYAYACKIPLIREGYFYHAVTMKNLDVTHDYYLYTTITGWTDTKLTLPANLVAIGME